jgi:phage-related protein
MSGGQYDIVARLRADSSQFTAGMAQAQAATASLSDNFGSVGKSMESFGTTMTTHVTLPIVAMGTATFLAFSAEEDAIAKMNAALSATGGVAGVTGEHIIEMASSLQQSTTFADDTTIAAGALLLTFKNLRNEMGEGNDVFDRTMRASQDLAAFMGTDLNQATMQLAKALQDPDVGMNQLRRSGVSFSEQQKQMVKDMVASGDMLGAQKLILAEVEAQFGGTAEAMAQTSSGQIKQALNDLGDAMEQFGAVIAPIIGQVTDFLKQLADRFQALSPETKEMIVQFAAIAAAIGPVILVVGKALTLFAGIGPALAVIANPVGIVIAVIAALVALIAVLYFKFDSVRQIVDRAWQDIQTAISNAWGVIQPILESIWQAIVTNLQPVLENLAAKFQEIWPKIMQAVNGAWSVIAPILQAFGWVISNVLVPVIAWLANFVVEMWAMQANAILDFYNSVVVPVMGAIVGWIKDSLIPWFQDLWAKLQEVWAGISAAISWAWNNVIRPIWDAVVAVITNVLVPIVQTLWQVFQTVFTAVGQIISFWWTTIVQPIWNAVWTVIQTVLVPIFQVLWRIVSEVFTAIGEIIGLAWGLIQPIWQAIQAYINGVLIPIFQFLWGVIQTVWAGVSNAISTAWGFISGVFESLKAGIEGVADFFSGVVGTIGDIFGRVVDMITAPFRTAFNFIADAWNNTIGSFSVTIPDIPGLPFGGDTISFPEMPKFHKGGMVPGRPGVEVPAMLQAGEFVMSRRMVSDLAALSPQSAASNRQFLAGAMRQAMAGSAAASNSGDTYHFTVNGVVARDKNELLAFLAQELPRAAAKHARSYG